MRRTHTRKKAKLTNKGLSLLEQVSPLSYEYTTALKIRIASSLHLFNKGEATDNSFNDLLMTFNTAKALAKLGLGADQMDLVTAAHPVLRTAMDRATAEKRLHLLPDEKEAVASLVALLDAQLEYCTVAQMTKAIAMGAAGNSGNEKSEWFAPFYLERENTDGRLEP